jgi:predicted RecA/RadA family phage recombinase
MSKNFVQEGKTIPLTNTSADTALVSGEPVVIGTMIAIAITDIAPGDTGDGFTEGVFRLPKLSTEVVTAGVKVYLKDGNVQLDSTDATAAGVAWEDAGAGTTVLDVKINA